MAELGFGAIALTLKSVDLSYLTWILRFTSAEGSLDTNHSWNSIPVETEMESLKSEQRPRRSRTWGQLREVVIVQHEGRGADHEARKEDWASFGGL